MAHGWNSYYHNATLSSNPGTLNRPSDSEETLSQHVNNYIGHHEFSNTVALHEPPTPNSNFNTHYYQNPNVTNSGSDFVYQRYYSETQRQADGQQTDKPYMQGCANRDVSEFPKADSQTSQSYSPSLVHNFQGFKQDCGMLTSSCLEDVSSDSDADTEETRPSCHYAANNLFSSPKAHVPHEHRSSQCFPHTENMTFPAARPSMLKTEVGLPSNLKTSETNVPLAQNKMESSNQIFKSYKWHKQLYMTTVRNEKTPVQNDYPDCQDQGQEEPVEKDCTQSICSGVITTDHENLTEDRIDGSTDAIRRNIASATSNITAIRNAHNEESNVDPTFLQKEVNLKNLESNDQNPTDRNWSEEEKGKIDLLRRERDVEGSIEKECSDDNGSPNPTSTFCQDGSKDIECLNTNVESNTTQSFIPPAVEASGSLVLKCNSALTSCIDDVESKFNLTEHQAHTSELPESTNRSFSEMDIDASVASLSKSCLQSQGLPTDVSLGVEKELATVTVQTNASLSLDPNKNSEFLPREMDDKSQSSLKSPNSSTDAVVSLDEKLSSEAEKTHFTSSQDPQCGGPVEIKPILSVPTSSTDSNLHLGNELSNGEETTINTERIDLDCGDPTIRKDDILTDNTFKLVQPSPKLELTDLSETEVTTSHTDQDFSHSTDSNLHLGNELNDRGETTQNTEKIDLDCGDPTIRKDDLLTDNTFKLVQPSPKLELTDLSDKEIKTSHTDQDYSQSNNPSERICVDTSDKNRESVASDQESCSQLNILDSDKYLPRETESSTVVKITETTRLEDLDHNSPDATSDNNVCDGFSCLESCSHQMASDMDEECHSKMECANTGKNKNAMPDSYQQASPLNSPLAQELPNQNEEEEKMDLSTEKLSGPDALFAEPLSRGDSVCVTDATNCKQNQCNDISRTRSDQENEVHSEEQQTQLQSSAQLRKSLHPIVILTTFEPTQEGSDYYHCAKCNHSTNSIDDLIEHHHCGHLMENFQFCKKCNIYQMRAKQADKHVCGVIRNEPQLPAESNPPKKSHIQKGLCKICGLVFKKLRYYIQHMRTHTGKTPFRCKQCGLYFAQNSSLGRHKRKSLTCKRLNLPVNNNDAEIVNSETPKEKVVAKKKSNANMKGCYVKLVDITRQNLSGGKSSLAKDNKSTLPLEERKRINILLSVCATKTSDKEMDQGGNDIEEKFKCPLCPRLFKYSFNRARHLRDCVRNAINGHKKNRDRKYQCPLCKSSFTFLNNVYRHIKAICFHECLSRLAKERENLRKMVRQKACKNGKKKFSVANTQKTKSMENVQNKQLNINAKQTNMSKETALNKQALQDVTGNTPVPPLKCALCPAVFHHSSGLYRHKKKHELSHITGKIVKYRKSVSSFSYRQKGSDMNIKVLKNGLKSSEVNQNPALSCHFCGKTLSSVKSRKRHELGHRGERPYRCLECGKGFKRHSHLISHKKIHQRRIQCTVCKKILPTIRELIHHRNAHLIKGVLQCPDCSLQFQYPAQLLKHVNTHKTGENDLPHHEDVESLKSLQFLETKEMQNVPKQLQCSLCKEKFDDSQVLRKHALTHISGSSSNECPFCKLCFNSRRMLLRHMDKHTGEKAFSCTHCGKQFYRYLFMKLHTQKCFQQSTNHHVTTNTEKKLYNCSFCSRVFERKNRLECHHKSHQKNSLHQCSKCKNYYGINKLKIHQKRCEGTAGHQASSTPSSEKILIKSTSQSSSKVKETPSLSTAPKLLQYKCPHCTQSFRYQSLYLRHLVSHTGVQPYACPHCNRRFRSRTMCREHEDICERTNKNKPSKPESGNVANMPIVGEVVKKLQIVGEAEYRCKFCTKSFMKPRSLRRHILTHNEVKPYHCKACDSGFSRYDHLKVHEARCKGRKRRLEVCIPKVSVDDVGRGWQTRFGLQPVEKRGKLDCQVCLRRFPAQSKLSRHITMFHTTKLFKCSRCGSSFSHERSLKKHRKMNKCKKSSSVETAASSLGTNEPAENDTHRIQDRIQPYFTKKHKHVCSYCPRVFASRGHLDVHTCLHTGERPFPCKYCGERFIRKDYVQRHLAKCTMKMKNQILCDKCGGNFLASTFENHRKICILKPAGEGIHKSTDDNPSKGFSCAYCSARFMLFSQLQEHFMSTHQLETVAKPLSPAPAQQFETTVKNTKKHSNDTSDEDPNDGVDLTCELNSVLDCEVPKSFPCSYCSMSFGSKAGLMGHVRVHTKANPFKCRICNRGFWNKTLLRNHYRKCRRGRLTIQQSDSSIKAKLDPPPKDSFKEGAEKDNTNVLQTNPSCKNKAEETRKDHKDNQAQSSPCKEKKEVKYQCSECDKSFTDGLMLISHLEDHGRQDQEKKNNTCTICGRVCYNQGNLEKHMKIHGFVKKHQCQICSKKFYTASELKDHKTCHDRIRHYYCKLCTQRFWTRPALCVHYNEEHVEDLFSCEFCGKKYASAKSRVRHYRKAHLKEYKKLTSTLQRKNIDQQSSSQVSTTGESDRDEDEDVDSEDSNSDSAPYFPCHVCGKTFTTSESLEDHQLCHLGKKPHECEECGKCFVQATQLQQHQRTHQSEFQCPTCGKGFVSLFALRKHKHTHGKSRPYRCFKCHLSFTTPSTLAEHMATHCEDNFPCDICDRVFLSKSNRDEHRKSHSSGNPPSSVSLAKLEQSTSVSQSSSFALTTEFKYRCGVCQERFRDPEELSEHGCMEAKEREYSCLDCDKHFLHASHLKKHRTTHLSLRPHKEYLCNQCNSSFSSKDFLSHLKSHAEIAVKIKQESDDEGGEPLPTFICPVCQHCCPDATELMCHFTTHLDDSKKIGRKTLPDEHKMEEEGGQHLKSAVALKCQDCGQSFLGNDALRQHHCPQKRQSILETKSSGSTHYQATEEEEEDVDVTGEELYNCPSCTMQFFSKSSLLEHQNTNHPVEKPFKCEVCGKSFAQRRYLRKHERRHDLDEKASGELQSKVLKFNCARCNTGFSTAQDLSSHMRLHAEKDVGAFRCDMCYKSFSRLSLLRQHQESHVGEVVYECTDCDKAFAFPHLLEEHQQTHASSR